MKEIAKTLINGVWYSVLSTDNNESFVIPTNCILYNNDETVIINEELFKSIDDANYQQYLLIKEPEKDKLEERFSDDNINLSKENCINITDTMFINNILYLVVSINQFKGLLIPKNCVKQDDNGIIISINVNEFKLIDNFNYQLYVKAVIDESYFKNDNLFKMINQKIIDDVFKRGDLEEIADLENEIGQEKLVNLLFETLLPKGHMIYYKYKFSNCERQYCLIVYKNNDNDLEVHVNTNDKTINSLLKFTGKLNVYKTINDIKENYDVSNGEIQLKSTNNKLKYLNSIFGA
jgi:hypothetical protein